MSFEVSPKQKVPVFLRWKPDLSGSALVGLQGSRLRPAPEGTRQPNKHLSYNTDFTISRGKAFEYQFSNPTQY